MRLRSTVPKEDMVYVLGLMDDLEKECRLPRAPAWQQRFPAHRTLAQQEKAGLGDLDDAAAVVENFGQELFLKAA